MGFAESKRAIAQIHFINSDNIAGTGFLIADRYLLTCAHVVKEALFGELSIGAEASVRFYQTAAAQPAEVIFIDYEEHRYGRDAAVLYLPDAPPTSVIPLAFHGLQQLRGEALQVFGYPDNDAAGRNITAVTQGEVDGGWVQIEDPTVTGLAIEPGFSGAPVWGEGTGGVVGMVVARHQGDDAAKVGFMLPKPKLETALQAVRQHSLEMLLHPFKEALSTQITRAYTVCRPKTWAEPLAKDLKPRLADLALMSANRLVEFAACLSNQSGVADLRADLIVWIERHNTSGQTLGKLLQQMEETQQQVTLQRLTVFEPCLLVRVQADKATQKAPYQVDGWLVANSRPHNPDTGEGYKPSTGEGADRLDASDWQKYAEESDSIDLSQGIRYEHLPLFLATYIDQVATRGIDSEDLTVEFFLPMALINEAIEQCSVPDEYGYEEPLGIDEPCSHVVVRCQERLDYARGLKRWEDKWNELQQTQQTEAIAAFVDGNDLPAKALQKALKPALGLKLTQKLPTTSNKGEIGVLLATGTPAAVWLRCHDVPSLASSLDTDILSCCLEQLPIKVHELRRNTCELDEDAPPSSPELGHHLSFLWEDFHRVPPRITYSDTKL